MTHLLRWNVSQQLADITVVCYSIQTLKHTCTLYVVILHTCACIMQVKILTSLKC